MIEENRSARFLEMIMPGKSEATRLLRAKIVRLNQEERLNKRAFGRPILFEGPPGAGKEFCARALCMHWIWLGWDKSIQDEYFGGNPSAPQWLQTKLDEEFYAVSVTDLMGDVGFTELVGCIKGAFSGAGSDRLGILGSKRTHILIDEIPDASSQLQGQLLRIVQHRKRRPVGGDVDQEGEISGRLLFAGNRPLSEQVRMGKFREDLYHRLQACRIELPPLIKTRDRIPELAATLVDDVLGEKTVSGAPFKLSQADLDWASKQSWPGNVRQLRQTVETWVNSAILDGEAPLLKDCLAEDEQRHPSRGNRTVESEVLEMVIQLLNSGQEMHGGFAGFIDKFRTLAASALFHAYEKRLVSRSIFQAQFKTKLRSVIDQARKYYDDDFTSKL